MKFARVIFPVFLAFALIVLAVGCARKPPVITKIEPASGPLAGGTTITITGTGFKTGDTVTIGGAKASNVTVKPGKTATITATTPPGTAAGPVDVIVASKDGKVKSAPKTFTYYEDVTVTTTVPENMAELDAAPEKVSVTFNQDIVEGSVSIKVADAEGTAVDGTVEKDEADPRTFNFKPAAPIAAGKDYTVTVSGAKGNYENVMADYTFSFKVKEAAKKAAKKK